MLYLNKKKYFPFSFKKFPHIRDHFNLERTQHKVLVIEYLRLQLAMNGYEFYFRDDGCDDFHVYNRDLLVCDESLYFFNGDDKANDYGRADHDDGPLKCDDGCCEVQIHDFVDEYFEVSDEEYDARFEVKDAAEDC